MLSIADRMIVTLEEVHSKRVIHRDIKPENWCIGEGEDFNSIYLIDYGLSKVYENEEGEHIPMNGNKTMLSQAIFSSVNSHKQLEVSRRDDLESLVYMLMLMVVGDLPWIKILNPEKNSPSFSASKEQRLKIV